jgi:hypothetical protein
MKLSLTLVAATALVAGAAGFATARSLQEGGAPPMAGPQPTEMHKWMTGHAGDWDASMTGSMGDSKATMKIESGPGGLWTLSHYKDSSGAFEGREFMGYDAASDTFNNVWIDSMTMVPMLMMGKYDAKAKKLEMKGEAMGPDGKMGPMRAVTEYPNPESMIFTMYGGPTGADAEMFKITYARRKK